MMADCHDRVMNEWLCPRLCGDVQTGLSGCVNELTVSCAEDCALFLVCAGILLLQVESTK